MQSNELDNFYNAIEKLNVINQGLSNKRDELEESVRKFQENLKQLQPSEKTNIRHEELAKKSHHIFKIAQESVIKWKEGLDKSLEREKFRSELKNSFIVMIFGKVKAGKSYLGNFIAKNRPNSQKVKFFRYDEAGKQQEIKKLEELNDDEGFKTHHLECTSSIQGFMLSGMAWIDTPGLGSMTTDNGKLAEDYIDAADYIIYPSASGSPFQMDEVKELGELFRKHKKATVILTKSDIIEEDEYNGKIIKTLKNKDQKTRQAQEQYANEVIRERVLNAPDSLLNDIFSVSTKAANDAIEKGDRELFQGSNLPKLYETMTDIVQNKANKLKREATFTELQSLIEGYRMGDKSSIKSIKKYVEDFENETNKNLNRLKELQQDCQSEISGIVRAKVAQHGRVINKYNLAEELKGVDKDISDALSHNVQESLKEIAKGYEESLMNFTNGLAYEFKIQDKKELISVPKKKSSMLGKIAGAATGAGIALATGGASLAVAGAAALVGGYLGSKIGESTPSDDGDYITIGDTTEEVLANFTEQRIAHYTKEIEATYRERGEQIFTPLSQEVANIRECVEAFDKELEKFAQELSHANQ